MVQVFTLVLAKMVKSGAVKGAVKGGRSAFGLSFFASAQAKSSREHGRKRVAFIFSLIASAQTKGRTCQTCEVGAG